MDSKQEISRILHIAFKEAQKRKKVLHNIHKSNVLKSSVLWNQILDEVAPEYRRYRPLVWALCRGWCQ